MPDGSKCSFTHKCGSEGTDVSNDQCGGATSVSWTIPDHSDVDDCGFGIYSIGFDCSPGTGGHTSTSSRGSHSTVPVSVPVVSVPTTAPVSIPVTVPGVSTEAAPTTAPAGPSTTPCTTTTGATGVP